MAFLRRHELYEGESIIIRTVCFIFIKTMAEILQLHNFQHSPLALQCTLSITAQSAL
jgi:hypothetical protein